MPGAVTTIVPGSEDTPDLIRVGYWIGPRDRLVILSISPEAGGAPLLPYVRAGYRQVHEDQADNGDTVVYLVSPDPETRSG